MPSNLKGNKDANAITESAVLKVEDTNRIRERYRAICEIPENPIEIELGKKQEIDNGRGALGVIQAVGSEGEIDKLNDLRYKMHPGEYNLQPVKSEIISGNEIPDMGKEIPKEGTYN